MFVRFPYPLTYALVISKRQEDSFVLTLSDVADPATCKEIFQFALKAVNPQVNVLLSCPLIYFLFVPQWGKNTDLLFGCHVQLFCDYLTKLFFFCPLISFKMAMSRYAVTFGESCRPSIAGLLSASALIFMCLCFKQLGSGCWPNMRLSSAAA